MPDVSEAMRQEIEDALATASKPEPPWPYCAAMYRGRRCHRKARHNVRLICLKCADQFTAKICGRCFIDLLRHKIVHHASECRGTLHRMRGKK